MKIVASLFFLFIVHSNLFAQNLEDSNKIDLHVNLVAGDTYFYSTSTKQNIIQEVMGETIEINQEFTTDFKYFVESNNNNSIKIKATYERIDLLIDSPEDQIDYSSSREDSDSRFSMLNNLIGKSFYIFMNTTGKVFDITGFNELTKNMNLGKFAQQLLTDSSLLRSLNMDIYPDEAIIMGESWNKTAAFDISNLKLKNELIYTLEGTSEDLVWLNLNGKISGNGTADNFDMDLIGNQSGTIETDLKSGMISSSDIKTEIEATIKSLDLEIPVKVLSETKVSGRKL